MARKGQRQRAKDTPSDSGFSEERLHRWLAARRAPEGLVGSRGHDAAVLRAPAGRLVCCADQTIEGVHFEPEANPRRVGHKAVARVLSDLAATAAEPLGVLLTVRAPAATSEGWIKAVIGALDASGRRYGAPLVGGDLAAAPGPRALSVSGFGRLDTRRAPPGRDRARVGDVLLATGPFGGSRLGRHLRIRPRLEEGRWLYRAGAGGLMDVSDGLALDLTRLARASGVRIELETVPVHPDARRLSRASGRSPEEHALSDGEDHELLATLAAPRWRRLESQARERFPKMRVIGRVRAGRGVWRASQEGLKALDASGWRHGTRP